MTNLGKMAGLLTLKKQDPLRSGGGTCVPALNFRYGRFGRFEE